MNNRQDESMIERKKRKKSRGARATKSSDQFIISTKSYVCRYITITCMPTVSPVLPSLAAQLYPTEYTVQTKRTNARKEECWRDDMKNKQNVGNQKK